MKRLLLLALAAALPALYTPVASALIELRVGYGVLSADPSELNEAFGPTTPKIDSLSGIFGDAIVELPMVPVGLGVRYEYFMQKENANGNEAEAELTRVSLLVNKRFIDTVLYVGAIGTVGLMNDFDYKINGSSLSGDASFTASAGIEAGVDLLFLSLGGEVGYMYAPMGELSGTGGTLVGLTGAPVDVDLSGPYVKANIGIGF